MRKHALSELEDATRLVEKITALGGEPTIEAAPFSFKADPAEALDQLVDCEGETLEALQAAIEPTGREAASEAVEHRLEHMIMRKQEQVDYLLRARRRPRRQRRRGGAHPRRLTAALAARQLLIERQRLEPAEAIRRLTPLQAQHPTAPYYGSPLAWTASRGPTSRRPSGRATW